MKIDLDEVRFITETSITIRGSRRRITVPKEVVDYFELNDGDRFVWVLYKGGDLTLVPKKISSEVLKEDGVN